MLVFDWIDASELRVHSEVELPSSNPPSTVLVATQVAAVVLVVGVVSVEVESVVGIAEEVVAEASVVDSVGEASVVETVEETVEEDSVVDSVVVASVVDSEVVEETVVEASVEDSVIEASLVD